MFLERFNLFVYVLKYFDETLKYFNVNLGFRCTVHKTGGEIVYFMSEQLFVLNRPYFIILLDVPAMGESLSAVLLINTR